ncbi:MAG: DNA primase [Planctomycetota bacterium]|nr:DNA primase [Planctomycetota bacterium]
MNLRDRISEIKSRINILDVVSASVSMKKAGRQWVGLCPFHPDTKPSFYVSTEKQTYRCYGCGAAGDVISFLKNFNHLSFKDAVTELARRAGVELKWRTDPVETKSSLLFELNTCASNYYQKMLYEQTGKNALEYLTKKRGFKRETLEEFGIGYAPPNRNILEYLLSKGFSENDMVTAGISTNYEGNLIPLLRNRVVFPITEHSGKVVGFGGRSLSDEETPKYLNSPETPIFKKSSVLYGIKQAKEEARKSGEMLITEGYTDVMMAHQRAVKNVCAVLGTAFTLRHAQSIKHYAECAILLFDSDKAGEKAATRSVDILLSAGLDVRIAQLPEGFDLCDFMLERSDSDLKKIPEKATRFIEFLHSVCVKEYGESVEGRRRTIERLSTAISYIEKESERELWVRKVADRLGVTPHIIMNAAVTPSHRTAAGKSSQPSAPSARDCELLEMMLLEPTIIEDVANCFSADQFEDKEIATVAAHIFKQSGELGTFDLESLYSSENGQRLREKVKMVLQRAERLMRKEEKRDYQKILNGWLIRSVAQKRLMEIKRALKSDDTNALLEIGRLKRALESDDIDTLSEICRNVEMRRSS